MDIQPDFMFDRPRSQEDRILAHLKSGRSITPIEALNLYKSFRLGARIHTLKKQGYKIEKQMVETPGGAHVAQYRLKTEGL